jgi:hypothetical protein
MSNWRRESIFNVKRRQKGEKEDANGKLLSLSCPLLNGSNGVIARNADFLNRSAETITYMGRGDENGEYETRPTTEGKMERLV